MKHQKDDTLFMTALRQDLNIMEIELYAVEKIIGLAKCLQLNNSKNKVWPLDKMTNWHIPCKMLSSLSAQTL